MKNTPCWFALLITPLCLAQPTGAVAPTAAWANEPASFVGISLTGDFMREVPECSAEPVQPAQLCREATDAAGQFDIRGLPYLPISPGYKLKALTRQNQLQALVLTGGTNSLYLVKGMLTGLFGDPSSRTTQWITLKSGASFEKELLDWKGQRTAVNFQRKEGDLGTYEVTVTNLPLPVAGKQEHSAPSTP